MPRLPRVHVVGGYYHVTLRGNHRQDIFRSSGDRSVLDDIVGEQLARFDAQLHAYCWMTNHLHLLVRVSAVPLGRPMQGICSRYARWFQSTLPTTGHLFERRYHARLIDEPSYLLEVARYIHLNPVRAGLTPEPRDYPWSSHAAYVGARIEEGVRTDALLGMLSEDRAEARRVFDRYVRQGLAAARTDNHDHAAQFHRLESGPLAAQEIDDWLAAHCAAFGVLPVDLKRRGRDPGLSRIRSLIAREAVANRVASIAELARRFGRDESTLREGMLRLESEITPGVYSGTGRGQA